MRTRVFGLVLLASVSLHARELPRPFVQSLARAGIPVEAVSLVVEPADARAPFLRHNAERSTNVASVVKILTAYAALDLLGPAFTFRTDFTTRGTVENGVLDGDLHVRGGGDPRLTHERLWHAVQQLRSRGVREIRGDIVLDRSYFAPADHDPGAFDNNPRRAYNVGADALLVNYNAVDFRFVPDGTAVRVVPDPDLPNVEVTSRIAATLDACTRPRAALTYEVTDLDRIASVHFSGQYAVACGEHAWPLAVMSPQRFTESVIRWLWSQSGGVLRGTVREGPAPPEGRLLLRHASEPLAVLVRDMNKFSNNVVARHLFLALSAERTGRGDPAASAAVVADWLRRRGIEAPELVLENGSGLSRQERLSTGTLAAILRDAWRSPLWPELTASLPILGVDGTLRSRSAGNANARAHLKGGTLNEVQAAAGYVMDREGRRWVVAVAVNHATAGGAWPAFEALVEWVHERAARETRSRR